MPAGTSELKDELLWEENVRGGSTWSHILKRGTTLRITDLEGGANVGALFYNFECPVERYNMPDTLKAQHIARLTKGFVLYSDMGRVLCSITDDTCGWHDPIGGHSNAAHVKSKYGRAKYQQHLNDYHRNARDNFLVELGKWGLGERDLNLNVNFFSRVIVGGDGSMSLQLDNSEAGDYVDLRAEMNVLTILDTCQHALDPGTEYKPRTVQLSIRKTPPPSQDDPCRLSRAENGRGFLITERYFL